MPLEDLIESADLFVTVVPEALDGRDLNGDGDNTDNVLPRRRPAHRAPPTDRRRDGAGPRRHAHQRAAVLLPGGGRRTRHHRVPRSRAAAGQGRRERRRRPIRHHPARLSQPRRRTAEKLTGRPATGWPSTAALEIDGRSLAVSRMACVWFRVREALRRCRNRITRAALRSDGSQGNGRSRRPEISRGRPAGGVRRAPRPISAAACVGADSVRARSLTTATHAGSRARLGRSVAAFRPAASRVCPATGATSPSARTSMNLDDQVFIFDRDADGNGIFDEPGGTATVPGSTHQHSSEFDPGPARYPAITPSGRFFGFQSVSDTLDGIGSGISRQVWHLGARSRSQRGWHLRIHQRRVPDDRQPARQPQQPRRCRGQRIDRPTSLAVGRWALRRVRQS